MHTTLLDIFQTTVFTRSRHTTHMRQLDILNRMPQSSTATITHRRIGVYFDYRLLINQPECVGTMFSQRVLIV